MDPLSQNFRIPQKEDIEEQHEQRSPSEYSISGFGFCDGIPTSHKHKSLAFLVWLNYPRKYNCPDEKKQRTCPLIGCELSFDDQEDMLKHTFGCLQHSNGFYRCFKCGREEKIGKYHMNDLCDVEKSRGKLATAVNTVRLITKRITSHTSKRRDFERKDAPKKILRTDLSELPVDSDPTHCSELDSEWNHAHVQNLISEMPDHDSGLGQSYKYGLSAGTQYSPVPRKTNVEVNFNASSWQPQYGVSSQTPAHSVTIESNRRLSMYTMEDLTSPCSPVSSTDINPWHNFTPISPIKEGPSNYFGPSDLERSRRAQGSFNSIEYRDVNNSTSHSSTASGWGNGSSHVVFNSSMSSWNKTSCDLPELSGSPHGVFNSSMSSWDKTSCDLPELSEDASSRNTSMSSTLDSQPLNESWNPFGTSMILEGQDMFSEPESYDYAVELAGNEQRNICPQQKSSLSPDFAPNPHSLHSSHDQFHHEERNFVNNGLQSSGPSYSSPPNPPLPLLTPPRRRTTRRASRKNKCLCGYEPQGIPKNRKGNYKRHIKGCKVLRRQTCPESLDEKPWACDFPSCGKAFGRSDNLIAHQKTKFHRTDPTAMDLPAVLGENSGMRSRTMDELRTTGF